MPSDHLTLFLLEQLGGFTATNIHIRVLNIPGDIDLPPHHGMLVLTPRLLN